jgi:hypothetical protein
MRTRNSKAFDQAVEALGGVTATARILGRRPSQICQWRAKYGAFPAEIYWLVRAELTERGHRTPLEIFRFELAPRQEAG